MQIKAVLVALAAAFGGAAPMAQTVRNFDLGSSFGSPILYASFSQTVPVGPFFDTYSFGVTGELAAMVSITNVFFSASNANQIGFAAVTLDSTPLQLSVVNAPGSVGFTNTSATFQYLSTAATVRLLPGLHTLKVTGVSHNPRGTSYAGDLVMVPVPEPQTYALMLAGLGLIAGRAWRARRAASAMP